MIGKVPRNVRPMIQIRLQQFDAIRKARDMGVPNTMSIDLIIGYFENGIPDDIPRSSDSSESEDTK